MANARRTVRTQRGPGGGYDNDRASTIDEAAKKALRERRENASNNERRTAYLEQHRQSLIAKGLDPKLARGKSFTSLPTAGRYPFGESTAAREKATRTEAPSHSQRT